MRARAHYCFKLAEGVIHWRTGLNANRTRFATTDGEWSGHIRKAGSIIGKTRLVAMRATAPIDIAFFGQ